LWNTPRIIRRFLALAITLVALLAAGGAAPALAQGQSIRGTLEAIDGQEREPVEGVTLTVRQDGGEVGTAVSDGAGEWSVAVPQPGVYQVQLDTETLPDGVSLTNPDRDELDNVDVRAGQNKTVRFQLGPGVLGGVSDVDRFLDLVVLGLKLGAIIAMSAVGLSLVFAVTRLVNFAHGELVTLGAVIAFYFHASGGGPDWALFLAAIPAVVLVALFGAAQELWLWRPLRRRRTGLIAMLVVSIGLAFVIQNTVLVILNGEPRTYADYAVQKEVDLFFISTVPKNIFIIVSALIVLGLVGLFLMRTQTGVAMRAVADNSDLAESSGIDVNRIILATWIMGAGLAALGGIYFGVSENVQFNMGNRILLLIFAAVVLGGLGTAFGAMLGGFVIGVAVEVSTYWIDTELKTAIALAALIVMLLLRPQGLLGSKERIG
jgi:neutral amino acid transport system permease protein